MAWVSFKLGRPGYEVTFDLNPNAVDMDPAPVEVVDTNLSGDLKRSVVKGMAPSIKLSSNYLTKAQLDAFWSLRMIDDTFLSFIVRDDLTVSLWPHLPQSVNTVILKNNSASRLSAALVAGGFASNLTITGVFTAPDGSGTNYFTGGSYADATRAITLGSPLPNATQQVYVTFTYTGWLVHFTKFAPKAQGGLVDIFPYDIELAGA